MAFKNTNESCFLNFKSTLVLLKTISFLLIIESQVNAQTFTPTVETMYSCFNNPARKGFFCPEEGETRPFFGRCCPKLNYENPANNDEKACYRDARAEKLCTKKADQTTIAMYYSYFHGSNTFSD